MISKFTFTLLCNHHFHPSPERFYLPKGKFCPTEHEFSFPPSLAPGPQDTWVAPTFFLLE